ncbi:MAG: hypothetical protein C0501_30550 [Isosphaera sp.]|nr:hypothetical protein [Isosphaera sp.]
MSTPPPQQDQAPDRPQLALHPVFEPAFGAFALRVYPEAAAARQQVAAVREQATGAAHRLLEQVRREFVADGPGKAVAGWKQKLADAQADHDRAAAELGAARVAWQRAIGSDDAVEVSRQEKLIEKLTRDLARLEVRVPAVRREYERHKDEAAVQLRGILRQTLAGYRQESEARAAAALAAMTRAVNDTFPDWFTATQEAGGARSLDHPGSKPFAALCRVEDDEPKGKGRKPDPT